MKRLVSYLLIFLMVLTIIPSIIFSESYDKELKEAIVKSKELFSIGSEYDKFSQNINVDDESTIFNLNWSDKEGILDSIQVSITSEGMVVGYEKWKPSHDDQSPKLPKIGKDEGLVIAKDFIKKVSPEFTANIKHIESNDPLNINSDSYDYSFIRVKNEIPYYDNRLNISVDNSTGEVRSYYANWDMNIEFQDVKAIISLEEAKNLYKEKIGLDLIYKTSYEDRDSKLFLAYSPLETNLVITAKDGKIFPLYGFYNGYGGEGAAEVDGVENESLTPDEEEAITSVSKLISKEEAEKIGRDTLELDSDYKLDSIYLYTGWENKNEYTWDIYFMKEEDSNSTDYAYISINAKNKEVKSFYHDMEVEPDKKVQYNEKESFEIAENYIKTIHPEKFKLMEVKKNYGEISQEDEEVEKRDYSFALIRKDGNAYVEEDGVSIRVNAVNGRVGEYRFHWTDKKLPSRENLISKDKALDILFEEIGLELKYIMPGRYDKNDNDEKQASLVYGLKSHKPAIIDPSSGKILDQRGEEYKLLSSKSYNDIENSYAKDKINILVQYGIYLPSDEFKPKEKISQREFLYLLAKAHYPYIQMDYLKDDLYTYLINTGIVKKDEKSPDSMVTKEEGVKYIIRALNYDEIADLSEIYKDIFKDTDDIDPELKGYISIGYGLKIVQGYKGYLNPKHELKREDGANIIYNYLFNRI